MPTLTSCDPRSYASPARTRFYVAPPSRSIDSLCPKAHPLPRGLDRPSHTAPRRLDSTLEFSFRPFTVAISITNRYFTSLFSIRS